MEKRYIDQRKVMEIINHEIETHEYIPSKEAYQRIGYRVDMMRPEIVQKVGHWINHFDDLFPEDSTIECSVCHEHSPADMPHDNFCPNCGARMEVEKP